MARNLISKSTIIAAIIILFIALLFAYIFQLTGVISSGLSIVTTPVYTAFYSAGHRISTITNKPRDLSILQDENERLRNENLTLKNELSELSSAREENIILRQLLDYFENEGDQNPRVIARIIAKDIETPSILTLNVGEREGVKENNAVVVQDGIVIAKVIEVSNRTSKILLLSDNKSALAATIQGGPTTSKIAQGDRGLSIILSQIPQQELISKGQLVVTSGLEQGIPHGLIIGEVEEKISEQNDLFQTAILKPLIDYNSLRTVAVILSE